ncbi:hypothetical protein K402DRAFT_424543 [Aulographum hederae CBS 113979]|uniref:Exoribonuclease phosphorolytic domain-containing protein n=1 Tax=Aulographum hederae CBS 113979 TaxID=1176131 RepID=A0A6G1GNC4_9PEZI|nr:hypothetical protein K402DRAFT_424543 [Aulographum hederae CBS 113979]
MPAATATLGPLCSDGSATYTSPEGYTITGAVNGPIEVQRRDELPEEATIEVNIRPANGVGTTRERHLESLLHSTLRSIILTHTFPRTLIQLTLQIVSTPDKMGYGGSRYLNLSSSLPLLPSLLQTALLTLLSGAIPLRTTYTSTLLAVSPAPSPSEKPTIHTSLITPQCLASATSLHVFTFTPAGDLLLAESEGSFDIETWERVYERAEAVCIGDGEGVAGVAGEGDEKAGANVKGLQGMEIDSEEEEEDEGGVRLLDAGVEEAAPAVSKKETPQNLGGWVKGVVEAKVKEDMRWKNRN